MGTGFPERRLLISDGKLHYRVFKFGQAKTDGSIYITCPSFSEIKWLAFSEDQGKLTVSPVDFPREGHISVHGRGMASIRSNSDTKDRRLVIAGNYLLNLPEGLAGVRHLFSVLPAEPNEVQVNMSNGDYVISSSKPLSPFALIFFAVPRVAGRTHVDVITAFHVDDLENGPGDVGFGAIDLRYHSVVWCSYKTRHMRTWPNAPHICYYDGFYVPAFMGKKGEEYKLMLINPKYQMNNEGLKIILNFTGGISSAGG